MRHRIFAAVHWVLIVTVVLLSLASTAVTVPVVVSQERNSIPSEVGEP